MMAAFEAIWERKVAFFATFFVVFSIMYGILLYLDFLPEAPIEAKTDAKETIVIDSGETDPTGATATAFAATAAVEPATATVSSALKDKAAGRTYMPTTLTIPTLDKQIDVLNPDSRIVADLDAALLEGVVRHPDSALLNQDGNLFILGHSSYLPNVLNKNFQAFNGIQNLEWGDTIEVASGSKTFTFRVEKVYRAKASDLTVPIAGERKQLTLATCNSFGSVDDRYIVEAYQIET